MPIAEICQKKIAVLDRRETVAQAAKVMRERHVGDVIVTDSVNDSPIGILTDRDIVVGLIAMGIPPDSVSVGDVMTPSLVTIREDQGVYEAIQVMERYGVKRLPVMDKSDQLIGIVSSNDLMELLGREMIALSKLNERQKNREREIRL